jgi:hypothetical protein
MITNKRLKTMRYRTTERLPNLQPANYATQKIRPIADAAYQVALRTVKTPITSTETYTIGTTVTPVIILSDK